jgi:hypothetical protein
MVVQRKNLLEAFRDAGSKPSQEPEPAAGPFAQGAAPARARVPRAPRARLPVWLPWACGVALAFVLGVAIGRKSASLAAEPSRTDEEEPARSETEARLDPERAARPASSEPIAAQTPDALQDPANRYTIVVAAYDLSSQAFAFSTQDQLADLGLPVWPVAQRGKHYIVLVGAAPDSKDLAELQRRVASLADWNGKPNAYADAYVARIDDLIDR